MESERRSTMSSLKGQLSNVEGSVKSMKAAVVVGSVLTVACLAAVFGVTILANEVSKEVKVSNGTLSTKDGKAVLTTTSYVSEKMGEGAKMIGFNTENAEISMAVNAVVVQGTTVTTVCDDVVVVQKNGQTEITFVEGSAMATLLGDDVESRSVLSKDAGKQAAKKGALRVAGKWAGRIFGWKAWLAYEVIGTFVDCATGGDTNIGTLSDYIGC